ncbi:MAG: hypothetical protein ACRCT7_05065 [Shewanella sp.]
MNYFRCMLVCACLSSNSLAVAKEQATFADVCGVIAGQWVGPAASTARRYLAAQVEAICSHDGKQLMLMTTLETDAATSSWWFVQLPDRIQLMQRDNHGKFRQIDVSLYDYGDGFSFLGLTEVNGREALLKLIFEPLAVGWQWQQQLQYLDDDSETYQVFLSVDLVPKA